MGLKSIMGKTMLAHYTKRIKDAPREVILSPALLLSCAMYATAAIPLTWDQGTASTLPSLEGFQKQFGISSTAGAHSTRNFVSLVYIGDAVGAALSFFINDRIGRLWSFRLYTTVWIIGQLVATFSPNSSALYASRIISGLGIGSLSVTGTVSIVELAPPEIRGLLAAWYTVSMTLALMVATFCVYGVQLHIGASRLQYQVVMFSPCVFMLLWIIASFFLCESPRWLVLSGRNEEAANALVRLRRLPLDHDRVQHEFRNIEESIQAETAAYDPDDHSPSKIVSLAKETFTVPSNLRRLQQALILYAVPQFSGGNSITNYFIPILKIVGLAGSSSRNLFLNGMYAMSKFFFGLIGSFFLIDVVGRRNTLFVGITLQMISDIYLAAYIKVQNDGSPPGAAGEAALASIFIHSFGYTIGLLTLPYVFGGELWPNRIRSFGAAITQTFHWLFHYSMTFALPSLLSRTHNWGAFVFFASWCAAAILYVYLLVPEISGLSVEEIERVFSGPWRLFGRRSAFRDAGSVIEGREVHHDDENPKGSLPAVKSSQQSLKGESHSS
ncbi:putative quinate permease [Penicillium brevicompactum]